MDTLWQFFLRWTHTHTQFLPLCVVLEKKKESHHHHHHIIMCTRERKDTAPSSALSLKPLPPPLAFTYLFLFLSKIYMHAFWHLSQRGNFLFNDQDSRRQKQGENCNHLKKKVWEGWNVSIYNIHTHTYIHMLSPLASFPYVIHIFTHTIIMLEPSCPPPSWNLLYLCSRSTRGQLRTKDESVI